MPKCINDETKFYSGYELSPRGLGYSADKFEPGYKQLGKDGNMWIVQKSKEFNRWYLYELTSIKFNNNQKSFKITKFKKVAPYYDSESECDSEDEYRPRAKMCVELNGKESWIDFDFNKLPENFYTDAYFPICEKITGEESGLEDKFGGSFPYLTENKPPKKNKNGQEYQLLCQFKDPRYDNNTMFQIFYDSQCIDIRKIKLDDDAIKNQYKYNMKSKLQPYKIVGWKKVKELIPFEKLKKKLRLNYFGSVSNIIHKKYADHPAAPSKQLKLYHHVDEYLNVGPHKIFLIQIVSSSFLSSPWGMLYTFSLGN
jgi:hypothetical protein